LAPPPEPAFQLVLGGIGLDAAHHVHAVMGAGIVCQVEASP